MSINELRAISTFVRTVELGSLSKAAEAQQISLQAASKALGQLEQYLGVRLFHRITRSMSLTEEGLRAFWMPPNHRCLVCSRHYKPYYKRAKI